MPTTKAVPTVRPRVRSATLSDAQQKKAIAAWRGIFGIWANKKLEDPVQWQRRIRADRKLPK